LPDGGRNNDKLEDFFSEIETCWPSIVEDFRAKKNVNEHLTSIFSFIILQRVRVPATRDACEKALAEFVKVTAQNMEKAGLFPPPPKGFEDILDHIEVAIDPHRSIHAMVDVMKGVGELLDRLGICVIHNRTDVPFITSDNPVVWFDPTFKEHEMRPYAIRPDGPVILMFPVAPDLMIYGDTDKKDLFAQYGLCYSEPSDTSAIATINKQICRFSYETVYANASGFSGLVREYADVAPVIRAQHIAAGDDRYLFYQYVWGKRERKPRWVPRDSL
jgi:hypothetical protein